MKGQTYAITLGKFRIKGMEEIDTFIPTSPDTVTYDPNSGMLTPVRSQRLSEHELLGRFEEIVFGQMDPATLRITETRWERTRVVIENEKEVPLGSLPTMSAAEIQKRHSGLAFVVVGRFTGITPREYNSIAPGEYGSKTRAEYVNQELHIQAERIELKDVCANEVLWSQVII